MPNLDRVFEIENGILLDNLRGIFVGDVDPTYSAPNGSIHLTQNSIWQRILGNWSKIEDSPTGFLSKVWFKRLNTPFLTTSRTYITIPNFSLIVPSIDVVVIATTSVSVNANNRVVYTAIKNNNTVITNSAVQTFMETSNKQTFVSITYGISKSIVGTIEIGVYTDSGTLTVSHVEFLIIGAVLL